MGVVSEEGTALQVVSEAHHRANVSENATGFLTRIIPVTHRASGVSGYQPVSSQDYTLHTPGL